VTVGTPNAEVQRGLKDAQAMLKAAGMEATVGIIAGPAEQTLGDLVDENGYDLLVMGAYGHSRIRSLIIGSTTTEMIRSCKVPVVLIR
jgi:nucleotide-binding universal stress UspA family protein